MASKYDKKPFDYSSTSTDIDTFSKRIHHVGESLASYIKTNAKEYLTESNSGKYYFYRGFHQNNVGEDYVSAFIKKTRLNRKSKDTSKNIQLINNYFIDLVGGTANRSNSVFATSNKGQANEYGRWVYIIIPLGDMWYTWSPKFKDWYGDDEPTQFDKKNIWSFSTTVIGLYHDTIRKNISPEECIQLIVKHDNYLPNIIQNWLFSIIKKNKPIPPLIKEANKVVIPELQKIILGDDGTLAQAFKSKNEIFFSL